MEFRSMGKARNSVLRLNLVVLCYPGDLGCSASRRGVRLMLGCSLKFCLCQRSTSILLSVCCTQVRRNMAQRPLFPSSGVLGIAPGRMDWFCCFFSGLSGRPHPLSPHTSGFETKPLPFTQISQPSLTCPVSLRRSTLPGEPSSNWEGLGKSEGDPKRKGEKGAQLISCRRPGMFFICIW